jgi:hypothetical protein
MKHQFVIIVILLSGCVPSVTETPSDLPPLSEMAQSRRIAAFQNALEFAEDDHPARWQVSDDLRGSIVPIDSVRSQMDGWCPGLFNALYN